mmetsp:Transcript_31603/g.53481  ORF Transcript_31603/g.53481 Transcript_31603/m.53481 type:complete len:598 (-) Transcript_31603:167-1960(-)
MRARAALSTGMWMVNGTFSIAVKVAAIAMFGHFLMMVKDGEVFRERSASCPSPVKGNATEDVFRGKAGYKLKRYLDESLWRTSRQYNRTSTRKHSEDGLKERLYESQTEIHGKFTGKFLDFQWTVDENRWVGTAKFEISTDASTGWVAIGFSPTGGMNKADIIMLRRTGDDIVLEDRYSEKVGVPTLDKNQDVTLEKYTWGTDVVSFTFSRQRNTNDKEDWPVNPTVCWLIWAAGTRELQKGHYFQHSRLIDIFRGGATPYDISQLAPSSYLELMNDADFKHEIILNTTRKGEGERGARHPLSRLLTWLWCSNLQGEDDVRDVATYITRCEASEGKALLGMKTKKQQVIILVLLISYFLVVGVLRLGILDNTACLLAGLFCADFYSYAAHVILDCYSILNWPILRPSAVGFQGHHEYPSGVLNTPYAGDFNLMFVTLSVPIGLVSSLFVTRVLRSMGKDCHRDDSQASLYLWARTYSIMFYLLYAINFVMNFHAFAHITKEFLPKWVQLGMESGFILSTEVHIRHHIYYDRDFAVINGWSNPLGNALGALVDPQNEDWVYIVPTILVLPFIIAICLEFLWLHQRLSTDKGMKILKIE